jgi:hypothetical protein
MEPRDVFISHAEEDGEIALRLARELRENGQSTWIYEEDAVPGISHLIQSSESIEACHTFLLIASAKSVHSREVIREVEQAHQLRKVIVPVRVGLSQDQFTKSDRILRMATGTTVTIAAETNDLAAVARRITGSIRATRKARARRGSPARFQRHSIPEMLSQPTRNPIRVPWFHFGGVVPPESFIGRDVQLREAERIIQAGCNFLVVGDHRDGKTSLCKMLMHRSMNRSGNTVLPVYLNVQQWPDVNIETFLEHTILGMVGEISREVFQCKFSALQHLNADNLPGHLRGDDAFRSFLETYRLVKQRTAPRGRTHLFNIEQFRHIHSELLEIIKLTRKWTHCVVFYDEANRLTKEIPVEQLVSHEEQLTLSGRISVYAATREMALSFGRLNDTFAHEVVLEPFNLEEVRQLLSLYWSQTPGSIDDLPVTDDAVLQLWKSTDGQPYRVQLLAGCSFTIANERGASVLSRTHVEAALEQLQRKRPTEFSY